MLIRTLLFGTLLFLSTLLSLHAQTARDALIHTQTTLTGTARTLGMGGAFSAVGADLSAATLNPAGLGLYRSSSFVISPEFSLIGNEATFLDQQQRTTSNLLRLPSLGIAFNKINYTSRGSEQEEVREGIVSYTFALGYNNLENYNRVSRGIDAFNPFSSITEQYAERSQGIDARDLNAVPFGEALSFPELYWQTFVIDVPLGADSTEYFPVVSDGRISQTFQVAESGRRNEWYAALGANFSNQLYIGGSVGLQQVRYEQIFDFNEDDLDQFHEFFNNDPSLGPLEFPTERMAFTESFTTRGTGINGKIGLIYRPSDAFRFGLSAQTPTYFSLTDNITQTTLSHTYLGETLDGAIEETTIDGELPPAEFSYTLSTPFRANAGIMVLVQKQGFISADVEYVDYGSATYSSATGSLNDPNVVDFTPENNEISDLYQAALNLRLGGELRIDIYRLRAGYAYHASPLSEAGRTYLSLDTDASDYRDLIGQSPADLAITEQLNGSRQFFTLGAGIRQPNFFLDVSLINQRQQDKLALYTLSSDEVFQPNVLNTRVVNRIVFSLGFNY